MEDPSAKGGRIGGHKGGEAALHSGKVSAAQLASYIKGITFPADKQRITSIAKSNGAPDNVMQFVNKLPNRNYTRPTEIEQEFSKLK